MAMTYEQWSELFRRLDSKGWRRIASDAYGVTLSLTRKGRTFGIYVRYNGGMFTIQF